jgi:hypothetical protein
LLDDVSVFVRRFVVLSNEQLVALTLFVAHTFAVDAADTTPYIAITSAEKRSGKTRLLETLELLVARPLPTANISDAALFRAISEIRPTLLFDEVDAVFTKAREREDLRGLLNAGYRRGAVAHRMGGARMTTLEAFPVFCPKVLAGIGALPDTIADRSISIRLQRRTRDEKVERFRRRDVEEQAEPIRVSLESLMAHVAPHLDVARPSLPDELDDRAQDVWEPLLAIADVAGGVWAEAARTAALRLSTGEERDDDSLTSKLIVDIFDVFERTGEQRMRTADLIDHLSKIEESPWGDWHGKQITAQQLSRLLKPYRIRTMPVWVADDTVRGYKVEQFTPHVTRVRGVSDVRSGIDTDDSPNAPNALDVNGVRPDLAETQAPNATNAPNAHPRDEQEALDLGTAPLDQIADHFGASS